MEKLSEYHELDFNSATALLLKFVFKILSGSKFLEKWSEFHGLDFYLCDRFAVKIFFVGQNFLENGKNFMD